MVIDTHAHYDDARFDGVRERLLPQLHRDGVAGIVNAGASLESSCAGAALADAYDFIWFAAGVHPSETGEMDDASLEKLRELLRHPKAVAVGEIGLDYHSEEPSREWQQRWFSRQLSLAVSERKPVLIHDREAHTDCVNLLTPFLPSLPGVVFHCFSGSWELAQKLCDQGVYLGMGGVTTFKNARKSLEVAAKMPLNLLLLETDCPYLAPEPHRGSLNHSGMLSYVVEKIAQVRGISSRELEEITCENARRFFGTDVSVH